MNYLRILKINSSFSFKLNRSFYAQKNLEFAWKVLNLKILRAIIAFLFLEIRLNAKNAKGREELTQRWDLKALRFPFALRRCETSKKFFATAQRRNVMKKFKPWYWTTKPHDKPARIYRSPFASPRRGETSKKFLATAQRRNVMKKFKPCYWTTKPHDKPARIYRSPFASPRRCETSKKFLATAQRRNVMKKFKPWYWTTRLHDKPARIYAIALLCQVHPASFLKFQLNLHSKNFYQYLI
jgi:hypothetical protein